MSDRPGVMLYFEEWSTIIDELGDGDLAALFRGIIRYAQWGEVPQLPPILGCLFGVIKPRIDADAKRYMKKCEDSRYAVYCRECKANHQEPLSREDWSISVDIDRYPTTAPSTTPSPTPATAATASPPTNATEGGAGGNRKASSRNEHIDGADLSEAYTSPSISDHLFPSTPPPKEKEFDDLKVERMAMLSDHIAKQRRTG